MKRIQRKRTKGWRMPEGAIYVGRPSLWGNPWRPQDAAGRGSSPAAFAVAMYRDELRHWGLMSDWAYEVSEQRWDATRRAQDESGATNMGEWASHALRGRDLVCWCPLDQPCHADVLLELANQ